MKHKTFLLSLLVSAVALMPLQDIRASSSSSSSGEEAAAICSGYCDTGCDDMRFARLQKRLGKYEESDMGLLDVTPGADTKSLCIVDKATWEATHTPLPQTLDLVAHMNALGWARIGDEFYAIRPKAARGDVKRPSSFFGGLRQKLPAHYTYALDGQVDSLDLLSWAAASYQRNFSTSEADKALSSLVAEKASPKQLFEARSQARITNMYRDLISTSLNQFTPKDGARLMQDLGAKFGASVTVIDDEKTLHDQFASLWEVGRGSDLGPNVTILEWEPKDGVAPLMTLNLVGKGVCFDTGGHNIKHDASSQAGMFGDKGGALAQLMLARRIMEDNLPIKLRVANGWVVNVPGARAQMQSDIYTYRVGTAENGNTDAEGRLVMGAILNDLRGGAPADVTMTMATLTGAALVAVGENTGILHAHGDDYVTQFIAQGMLNVHDPIRHLGIDPTNLDVLKKGSTRADLRTTGGSYGGSSTADAFLRWIATGAIKGQEDAPVTQFLHFDIACAGAGATGLTPGVTNMDMFAVRGAFEGLRNYLLVLGQTGASASYS